MVVAARRGALLGRQLAGAAQQARVVGLEGKQAQQARLACQKGQQARRAHLVGLVRQLRDDHQRLCGAAAAARPLGSSLAALGSAAAVLNVHLGPHQHAAAPLLVSLPHRIRQDDLAACSQGGKVGQINQTNRQDGGSRTWAAAGTLDED